MNKTELKLQYEVCGNSTENGVTAIIAAAGASLRMQGTDKQLLKIGGIPVIARTLMAFERCAGVKRIILVTRAESIFEMQLIAEKYMITKLSDIVCGGKSRQDSVMCGFARLDETDSEVIIHDGARPLISEKVINSVINALGEYSAVTCAVKIKDTVKLVEQTGKVIKTVERDSLAAVQTPQGVKTDKYLEAIKKVGDVSAFTDDTSIMESAGFEVFTVEGDYKNIKITTPEDVAAAEAYLSLMD